MEEDILQGQESEETTATPTINVGAMKALDAALAKKFGDKYFGPTNGRKVDPVKFISTGCMSIDYVLGGGLPSGRLLEIFGQPSCGKSLLSMQTVKSYQQQNKICAWIDVEACFEPTFATYCGVDVEKLAILQPDTAEEALEALRDFVKSGVVDLVVLDSVAALSSRTAQEKQVDEATMAVTARYMSKVLPELCPIASKNGTTIIFINQVRNTLKMYGASEDTPGGNAIKFYSSVRLKVTRKDILKQGSTEIGVVTAVKAVKNKCSSPFREKELSIYFPHFDAVSSTTVAGVDVLGDLVDAAIDCGAVNKGGAWLTGTLAGKDFKVQGKEKLKAELTANPDMIEDLKAKVAELRSAAKAA